MDILFHGILKMREDYKSAINEQTAYEVPGNSHSARLASMELLYSKLTGEYLER